MKSFFRQWSSTNENIEKVSAILDKLSQEDRDLFSGIFYDTLDNYHEYTCTDQRLLCCTSYDDTWSGGDKRKAILDAPKPKFEIPE